MASQKDFDSSAYSECCIVPLQLAKQCELLQCRETERNLSAVSPSESLRSLRSLRLRTRERAAAYSLNRSAIPACSMLWAIPPWRGPWRGDWAARNPAPSFLPLGRFFLRTMCSSFWHKLAPAGYTMLVDGHADFQTARSVTNLVW